MIPLLLAGVGAFAATKLVQNLLNDDGGGGSGHHYQPSDRGSLIDHPVALAEQQEQTKRQQLNLEHQTQQQAIRETREVIERYLDMSYRERRYVIEQTLQRLTQAIEQQQSEVADALIALLTHIEQHSPLEPWEQYLSQQPLAISGSHPLLKGV